MMRQSYYRSCNALSSASSINRATTSFTQRAQTRVVVPTTTSITSSRANNGVCLTQQRQQQQQQRSLVSCARRGGNSNTVSRVVGSVATSPARSYHWAQFFDSLEEERYIKPSEKTRAEVQELMNDTEMELRAYFEPLWGNTPYDPTVLAAVKSKIDEYEQFIRNTPEVKPVDFNSYRNRVSDPHLIDSLEAEYSRIQLDDQIVDYKKTFQPHYDHLERKAVELREQFLKIVDELEADLIKIKNRKASLRNLTYQELLDEHPEWRDEILEKAESDGFALHSLLRFKGDEQVEAQYAAAELAAEKAAAEHHHH